MDTLAAPNTQPSVFSADSCLSLASVLRCVFFEQPGHSVNRLHAALLIIPVALQLIASLSLVFTTSRSGREHLLLVAEGCVYFFLSLLEVISHETPAVRDRVPVFRAIDQTIGALSFLQIAFYMMFLYAFVRREVMPIIPTRIKRISQPLLLVFIPAVIAMNTVASFAGISYAAQPLHVRFMSERNHFVWTFFTALTLALLTIFQAACFCFAFYRLIRAFLIQRNIEYASKDAAVLYRGIGWINIGIKLGAIETVIGYVYYGVPIAYVRRIFRLLSRIFLCIGIAKGVDETEDFEVIQKELKSKNGFRRSKVRNFISNPRLSTFHHLSPTATAFHAIPRAPPNLNYTSPVTRNIPSVGPKAHPYSFGAPLPMVEEQQEKTMSPSGSLTQGLPGMSEFALVKAQRMSQKSRGNQRVTVLFHQGTPTLHLRLSDLDMPSPRIIVDSMRSQRTSDFTSKEAKEGWFSTSESNRTTMKEKSRFSTASSEVAVTVYPASTVNGDSTNHGHVGQDALYRYGLNPYGYVSSAPTSRASSSFPTAGHGHDQEMATTGIHEHSPINQTNTLQPPMPAYINNAKRYSEVSTLSDMSAVQAEIVNVPRRKLSFTRQKSTLAKAVFYPFPPTSVALALTEGGSRPSNDATKNVVPQAPLRQRPLPQPQLPSDPSPVRESIYRESIIDSEGNVITVTAIAPSPEPNETLVKRTTKALSGYSVGSVPETLQAVRELAKHFPGPPPGAVVANIGMSHIPEETPSLRERGSTETLKGKNSQEAMRNRIPTDGLPRQQPLGPLPPIPGGPSQSRPLPPQPQYAAPMAQTLDPFNDDDDTSYRGSELSPLSMSVKLRHPMSMISNIPTTAATSPLTPRFAFASSNNGHAQSQEGAVSPGVVDFGTALNEWNEGAEISPPPTAFTHRRSMSATTFGEIQEQQSREYHQHRPSDPSSSLDLADGKPVRIRSVRKSPRRITPKPVRSVTRESMHLQPLVIPVASSGRDVPVSAVGGVSAVSLTGRGFSVGRRDVYVEEQLEENGRLVLRDSEVLSMVDGGHVPIKLHGRKDFF